MYNEKLARKRGRAASDAAIRNPRKFDYSRVVFPTFLAFRHHLPFSTAYFPRRSPNHNFSTSAIQASSAFSSLCVLTSCLISQLTRIQLCFGLGPALHLPRLSSNPSHHQILLKLHLGLSIPTHFNLRHLGHKHKDIRCINLSNPHRSLTSLHRPLSLHHSPILPRQPHHLTRKPLLHVYLHTFSLQKALPHYIPNCTKDTECCQIISSVCHSDQMIGEK